MPLLTEPWAGRQDHGLPTCPSLPAVALSSQGLLEAQAQPEEGRPLGPQEAGLLCSSPEPEQ